MKKHKLIKIFKFIAILVPTYFVLSYTNFYPQGFLAEYGEGISSLLGNMIIPSVVGYVILRQAGFPSIKQIIEHNKKRINEKM